MKFNLRSYNKMQQDSSKDKVENQQSILPDEASECATQMFCFPNLQRYPKSSYYIILALNPKNNCKNN